MAPQAGRQEVRRPQKSTAIEALTEAWKKKKVKMKDLYPFTPVCRVFNVTRLYLQGVLESGEGSKRRRVG